MAARREAQEEAGIAADGLIPWTHRVKDGVDFTTFHVSVAAEFAPILNDEHDQYQWMTPEAALDMGGLHPGVAIALIRAGMDEGDIARAMAIEELASPQRYENLMLLAVRVTGTGASYRSHAGRKDEAGEFVGEYVWRDRSLYLNDAFLQRCQGLPVVMDHPETAVIDTEYFRDWVVGTLMLPFIRGDEVWAIARIYDERAQALLETEQLSTSPGVLVGGKRLPAADGRDIFVEGQPSLLDHLAICVLGVWDKGGPAAGVLNQSPVGDTTMAEKTTEEKILDGIHDLSSRMDAFEKTQKDTSARLDSMEGAAKDRAAKDAEAEEKAAKDRKDAEEKAAKDAADEKAAKDRKDAEEKAAKDAAVGNNDIKQRLDAIDARLKEPSAEERQQFVDAQVRADSVFQAFGDANGAPRWLAGESPFNYRKRLLAVHKDKSPAWKGVNLDAITDPTVLANIEATVYKDAMDAATRPVMDSAEPMLRAVVTKDATGRQITTFYGHPEACWGAFKHRSGKTVTGFNTKSDR